MLRFTTKAMKNHDKTCGRNTFLKRYCGEIPPCGAQENKANPACHEHSRKGQFDVKEQTKGAVNSEKLPTAANTLAG